MKPDQVYMITPEITSILDSNIPPNDQQVTSFEGIIDDVTTRIRALIQLRRKCRSALSAIRRIPDEILGEIFVHAARPLPLASSQRKYVLGLGKVCKNWNAVLRSTHALWSGVIIPATSENPDYFDNLCGWLARAGGFPKTVAVDAHPRSKGRCSCPRLRDCRCLDGRLSVVAKLLVHGPPLHHLSINHASRPHLAVIMEVMKLLSRSRTNAQLEDRPWDTLHSLSLDFHNEGKLKGFPFAKNAEKSILACLPLKLNSFTLILPNRVETPYIPSQILHRLLSFTLYCAWSGDLLLDILTQCHSLEHLYLDLRGMYDPDYYPDDEDILTRRDRHLLPHLQHLRLRPRSENPIALWDLVKVPRLSTLRIDSYLSKVDPVDDFERGESLRTFISASGCATSLHALHLYNFGTSPEDLLEILVSLPNLSHLVLDDVEGNTSGLWEGILDKIDEGIQGEEETGSKSCLSSLTQLELLELPSDFKLDVVGEVFLAMGRGFCRTEWIVSFSDGDYGDLSEAMERYISEIGVVYSVIEAQKPEDEFGSKYETN